MSHLLFSAGRLHELALYDIADACDIQLESPPSPLPGQARAAKVRKSTQRF
jgi:hypothetical protein